MEITDNLAGETAVKKHKNGYVDIDMYLSQCETALINASDSEIAPLLTSRSYTPAIIAAKKTELNSLKQLNNDQRKEYGDQYQATEDYAKAAALLHGEYMDNLKLARIVFKNDKAAQTTLGLKGKRTRSESGYCSQALLFYNGALASTAYKQVLEKVGITEPDLLAGQTGYKNLTNKAATKAKETGEAQGATSKRDQAIDDFDDWFSDFKEVAIIALGKHPQLRERLGWKE